MAFEIRPTGDEHDLDRWLALHNEIIPLDAITAEDVRSWMGTALAATRLMASEDGELVGVATGVLERDAREPLVVPLVPTKHRRRGIGSALFESLRGWAADEAGDALLTKVEVGDEESLGFAERRGFTEISRELRVALDLTGELLEIAPPDGIGIYTLAERPDLVGGVYEVYRDAVPDIPGSENFELLSLDDWLAQDMSSSSDLPEWTFLAIAGDEVAGYAKWSLTEAQPRTAHHDLTAVKRSWRGRGIAGALKTAQLRWAKAHGYTLAVTRNEERNEPIRRLNERFGYVPAGGEILLRARI
jgi:GNAT superfamily N-acetyltransferase